MRARLAGPLTALLLSACSAADAGPDEADQKGTGAGERGTAADGTRGEGLPSGSEEPSVHEAQGTLELLASGLPEGGSLVASGGYAFIGSRRGLVRISSTGTIRTLTTEHVVSVLTDGQWLAWTTTSDSRAPGFSAPLADLAVRAPLGCPYVQHAHAGYVYCSGDGILRAAMGKAGPAQVVTTFTQPSWSSIAVDATHAYYSSAWDKTPTEIRRARVEGGDSERVALLGGGAAGGMVVTETMIVVSVVSGGSPGRRSLLAVPKSGGLAERVVMENAGGQVAGADGGVYFTSTNGKTTAIYHVDGKAEHRRLVAQHYGSAGLSLAADETGLFAFAQDEGALYKLSKK